MDNILAALIGATAALLFTVVRDNCSARRRRKNIASAIVSEFRVLKRKIIADIKAVEQAPPVVVFDPPFSENLYNALLDELPDLGRHEFLLIRMVYSQLRQINYLKERLKEKREMDRTLLPDPLLDSYEAACKQGRGRIEDALKDLKALCHKDTMSGDLPPITDLTEEEKKFWGQGNI